MKEIKFEKARISEVKHNLSKVTAGTVPSAIKIVALMTSEIAQQIHGSGAMNCHVFSPTSCAGACAACGEPMEPDECGAVTTERGRRG